MPTPSTSRAPRWLFLALAVVLPLAATAQDRPDRTERLKQALDLTDAQVALIHDAVGDEAERGDLWAVAAALTPTLTDEQKERLFARPERGARGMKMKKMRGDRPERPNRPARPERVRSDDDTRAERRESAREAMQAGMQAALGLTDAQMQQFEALHAERKAEAEKRRDERQQRLAERPGPGELPGEVAAILTPEQQEIARVHRALAAHTMRGHHRPGGRH